MRWCAACARPGWSGAIGCSFCVGCPRSSACAWDWSSASGRSLRAAYGDSLADAEMLESAAEPVAVLPEAGLRRLAGEHRWRVLEAG